MTNNDAYKPLATSSYKLIKMDNNSENEDTVEILNPEIPEKSKRKYEAVYKCFMDWRIKNGIYSYSENALLTYFGELSKKYKSSSLWAQYSMIKSKLIINEGINIQNYLKLRGFLKRKAKGFQPKKAKTFTSEEINKFIDEAPDETFLATKVGLIMGIMGGCRQTEMYDMKTKHLEDLDIAFLVTVPNTTTKTVRKFTITDKFYKICKKYIELRPNNINSDDFFYQKHQRIGIHKFSTMWKQIAAFLNLPNPEEYSGRSFHQSTARLLVDAGGRITSLKKHAKFRSTLPTEDYFDQQIEEEKDNEHFIEGSLKTEIDIEDFADESMGIDMAPENEIFDPAPQNATSSNLDKSISINNESLRFDANSVPTLHFTNCSNINIYFHNKKVS